MLDLKSTGGDSVRPLVLLGTAVALVLALAASASGRGEGFITIKPGDEVDVAGWRRKH